MIGSATGEMPHSIIHGATGLIVPPGDVDALADALRAMLASPDVLEAMGQASRLRVLDRFGPAAFAAAGAAVVSRLPTRAARAPDRSASRAPSGRPA